MNNYYLAAFTRKFFEESFFCVANYIIISLQVTSSLLRSRSGRSHATLPVPTRGDGERCVTRAAAKETK